MKTLKQLLEETKGTYAGLRFSDDANDAIITLVNKLQLPNPITTDDIHMTLLYSRKYLPDYVAAGEIDEKAYPKEFHIFDTFDKKKALVIMVDCPYAQKRHKELMEEHQATYDFPEYLTHITLSYDIGGMPIPEWKDVPKELHLNTEYKEDLNFNWNSK